jgi:pyruvate-formate lyase-activating enzyme
MSGGIRHIDLNRACNQACSFCAVRAPDASPMMERARRAAAAVAEAVRAGARGVVFSGGEPTLEPYLPRLLAGARKSGLGQVWLETNGTTLADPQLRAALVEAGLTRAVVAWNAPDPERADAVSGDPGGSERTRLAVRGLLAAGVPVELVVVLTAANRGALADFVREIGQWPVDGRAAVVEVLRYRVLPEARSGLPLAAAVEEVVAALELPLPAHLRLEPVADGGVPACVWPDPRRHGRHLGLDPARAKREAARHQRLPACATCALSEACPGVLPTLQAEVTALARAVHDRSLAEVAPQVETGADADAPWRGLGLRGGPADEAVWRAAMVDEERWLPRPQRWLAQHGPLPDREVAELRLGLRSLVQRELHDVAAAEQVARGLEAEGLLTRVVHSAVVGAAGTRRVQVYVALDPAVLDAAPAIDDQLAGSDAQRDAAMRQLGAWLGYPACCVDAFLQAPGQSDDVLVARMAARQQGTLSALDNWAVVGLRPFSHLPCVPGCPATRARARQVLAALAERDPARVEAWRSALHGAVLTWSFERFVLLRSARRDGPGRWRYADVWTLADLGLGDHVLARPSFRAFELAVAAPLRSGDGLQWSDGGLQVLAGGQVRHTLHLDRAPVVLDFSGVDRPTDS